MRRGRGRSPRDLRSDRGTRGRAHHRCERLLSVPCRAAIALGCSLGDRRAQLERAVRRLDRAPGTRVLRVSRWWRTPPMRGGTARGWFLNGVVLVETRLAPIALLDVCIALEVAAGRRRARYWGDRTLDLDMLLYTGAQAADARLVLPHPGIRHRPFVLRPLLEVWRGATDPVSGETWAALADLRGPDAVACGVMPWPRGGTAGVPRDM